MSRSRSQRRVYRQWGLGMVAGVVGLIGLGVVLTGLAGLAGLAERTAWAGLRVALGAEAMALAWTVCLRPCVLVDEFGVTIRNILRDVRIPWAAITGVQVRWELVVFTARRGYPSWAIAGSPGPARRRTSRTLVTAGAGLPGADRFVAGGSPGDGPGGPLSGLPTAATDSRAGTVAAVIEDGISMRAPTQGAVGRYLEASQRSDPGKAPEQVQSVRVVPAALAALMIPLLGAVLQSIS